jgi:hypothetical protein
VTKRAINNKFQTLIVNTSSREEEEEEEEGPNKM